MGERHELAGRDAVGLSEQGSASSVRPCCIRLSARFARIDGAAAELERAPEMPFAGRQVVELRQDGAEVLMRVRIARVDAERLAGELLRFGALAVGKQQADELG